MPVPTVIQRRIGNNFSEKSILQFNDLPGDRLSDLQDTDRIERGKTVAGGRSGVETENAFFQPVARPVGMPEDEAVHAPEFLFHRLVRPWEHPEYMDQPQTETVYIEDYPVGEKTPNPGRIGIAADRPDLRPVKNIQNGKIGQIAGMQNQFYSFEGMLQNSPEFCVITPEMSI
jgi:hypothetical protein